MVSSCFQTANQARTCKAAELPGDYSMEPSASGSAPRSFMHQVLQNKILLLTVLLAVGAAVYFFVGLYLLLSR